MRINRVPLSSPFFLSLFFFLSPFFGGVYVSMCEGTIHFLHKDFGSSVFAVPGKCSKSGNAYFAAVLGTEHINILEKFTCVCRYAATYDFLTRVCVYTDRPRNAALCATPWARRRGSRRHAPSPVSKCDFAQRLRVDSGEIPRRFRTIKV